MVFFPTAQLQVHKQNSVRYGRNMDALVNLYSKLKKTIHPTLIHSLLLSVVIPGKKPQKSQKATPHKMKKKNCVSNSFHIDYFLLSSTGVSFIFYVCCPCTCAEDNTRAVPVPVLRTTIVLSLCQCWGQHSWCPCASAEDNTRAVPVPVLRRTLVREFHILITILNVIFCFALLWSILFWLGCAIKLNTIANDNKYIYISSILTFKCYHQL